MTNSRSILEPLRPVISFEALGLSRAWRCITPIAKPTPHELLIFAAWARLRIGSMHINCPMLLRAMPQFQFRYNNRINPDIFREAIQGC